MLRLKYQPQCYSAESWDADNILGGDCTLPEYISSQCYSLSFQSALGRGTRRHAVDE